MPFGYQVSGTKTHTEGASMHEMKVSGEIETAGLVDGSSGRFLGDIEGLYEGYRVGNPLEQCITLPVANGTVAVVLRHEVIAPPGSQLTRKRGVNPFLDGKDAMANPPPGGSGPPPGAGGPPGGGPPGAGGPPGGGPPGGGFKPRFQKIQTIKLSIDGAKSTGLYAGASGEMTLTAPNHKESGYMVVATKHGELRMNFRESVEDARLNANLTVDGDKSTGIYHNARGDLTFSLGFFPGSMAKGPYSGTLFLQQAPPKEKQ
jgi:hypothetical protein